MASSASTDDVPMEALVAGEKVESPKKARRATKVAKASKEAAVSAGYIMVQAEVPVSVNTEKNEESTKKGRHTTTVPVASSELSSETDFGSARPRSQREIQPGNNPPQKEAIVQGQEHHVGGGPFWI
jgi:hypothetical protein